MKSQQQEAASTAPQVEAKIYDTSGQRIDAIELALAAFVVDGWSIQFCNCLPSGYLVYTMFRATRAPEPKPVGMAVR